MVTTIHPNRSLPLYKKLTLMGTALALLGLNGCSSSGAPPSKTATGAGVGAAAGATVGALGSAATGGNTTTGTLAGLGAGAVIGGLIGLGQEIKDRKEQDRLAQERAYQQERAKKLKAEAEIKAAMDEEISIAQGFRISDMELNEAQKKLDDASERLKKLRDERAAALAKKKALDEAQERLLSTEAEIARLEEELARLKGENALQAPATAAASASP